MKKFLTISLVFLGLFAMTLALFPIEQEKTILPYATINMSVEGIPISESIIYEASFLSSIWELIKNLDWSEIIALLMAGGLLSVITSLKRAKKEILDVLHIYKESMKDGKIDEQEAQSLIKELVEAITESTKLWYMIVGIFKRKKKLE